MTDMTVPTQMTRAERQEPRLVDLGARVAVAAPVIGLFAVVVGAPLYTDDLSAAADTQRFVLTAGLSLAVLVALVFALVAIYLGSAHRFGRLGTVGFCVALTGTVLASGSAWDSLFTVPYLADHAPAVLDRNTDGSLLAGAVISYLALVLGWVLVAVASLRAKVVPRAAAIVLLVGAVLAIVPAPTALRLLILALGAALCGRAILRQS